MQHYLIVGHRRSSAKRRTEPAVSPRSIHRCQTALGFELMHQARELALHVVSLNYIIL